ncbi:MAG: methylmalonyl-CoA mutase family protein [Acidimicrobiaceae bacterium]|nr:methylmalonyl-CoA mutase family protein [Acidimicrobiaceae bacterium]
MASRSSSVSRTQSDYGHRSTSIALGESTFERAGADDWEAAAEGALRGAPLSSLRRTLLGGIETAPLYSPHRHSTDGDPAGLPGASPFARGAAATSGSGGWEVRQAHDVTLPGTPDAIAIDTTSGVDAVTVARGWNAESDRAALSAGIGDATRAGVTIHLQSGTSPAHAAALADVLERHSVDAERVRSWLGLDPIAAAASGWSRTEARDSTELVSAMCAAARSGAEIAQRSPLAVPLEADGSVFADAGASDATELAAMLATGVVWLRAICDSPDGPGLTPSEGARLLGFTLSAGPDPFGVTAKCRALRMCWTRILSTCGVDGTAGEGLPMRLHAVTSTAMLSALDPWVNMLRATTATFGAANGGVDAITVRPFDAVTAGPASSGLGWRVAANTQLILRHESRIGSVIDPAGGSWYLEDLTRKTAHAAWERFRQIEAAGGICTAMSSGEIEASIAAERARRHEHIDAGDQVLVGVTKFLSPEAEPSDMAAARTSEEQSRGGGEPRNQVTGGAAGRLDGGLGIHRWAAPYERGTAAS